MGELIEGNPTVKEASSALALIIDRLDNFAKRRLLDRWRTVLDVIVDSSTGVDSAAKGSSEALGTLSFEPNDSIDSTGRQRLRRDWLGSRLDEQLSLFILFLTSRFLHVGRNVVAR